MRTIKTKTNKKGFKVAVIALTLLMILAAVTPAHANNTPFADVGIKHWAYDEIMEAYNDGAVGGTGYADNGLRIYDPNSKVTMAQFTAILTRAFYPKEVENASGVGGAWYAPNYSVAESIGLFTNIPNNSPEVEVTREVMAQIMYNLMVSKVNQEGIAGALSTDELQTAENKIPDFESVSDSMGNAVATCYGLGLIAGVDASGSFAPKGRMNRAQTAVIYVRLKQAVGEMSGESVSNPGVNPITPLSTPSTNPGDTVQ